MPSHSKLTLNMFEYDFIYNIMFKDVSISINNDKKRYISINSSGVMR